MSKTYRIELNDLDLGQLLDGLEARAEAWEKTAEYHRTGDSPEDFIVEECTGSSEADAIANHYRSIISKVSQQMKAQSWMRLHSAQPLAAERKPSSAGVATKLPNLLWSGYSALIASPVGGGIRQYSEHLISHSGKSGWRFLLMDASGTLARSIELSPRTMRSFGARN